MYSCIPNVNILTALLPAHGIREAVVCPGSHNAPLVHNLNECGIRCRPVTDERSAGFVALGMALRLERPVAVCVTSGSALLNLLPAVAEAYYQQVPLVILSADRPAAWIDQLDGQTLPQPDALGRFVRKAVSLPEPTDETQRWHCNRLVNEALLAARYRGGGPVHINVPISRDLHRFDQAELPRERVITRTVASGCALSADNPMLHDFMEARRRIIIVGQLPQRTAQAITPLLQQLARHCIVIHECLGAEAALPCVADLIIESCHPDFILYLGRTLVSKPLRQWLRRQQALFWLVNQTGEVTDVSGFLTGIIEAEEADVLHELTQLEPTSDAAFLNAWISRSAHALSHTKRVDLPWSQAFVVRRFESLTGESTVCYANSSAVRLGNLFATRHRQCNRGVNGIEGSLSTAVGMALPRPEEMTFCVIGDLSFFYDQNALWVQGIGPNLRILLLNNGGGGIFTRFDGLRQSPARESLIMAEHNTTAEGICQSYGIAYECAYYDEELEVGLDFLMQSGGDAPRLLEVFTDMETDQEALNRIHTL